MTYSSAIDNRQLLSAFVGRLFSEALILEIDDETRLVLLLHRFNFFSLVKAPSSSIATKQRITVPLCQLARRVSAGCHRRSFKNIWVDKRKGGREDRDADVVWRFLYYKVQTRGTTTLQQKTVKRSQQQHGMENRDYSQRDSGGESFRLI